MGGRECVVLGAGGAGRAAAFGLIREKASVTLVNRSDRRAAEAASSLGCRAAPLAALPSLLRGADILISALPPGIEIVREEWLPERIFLMDANYVGSRLAETARKTGHTFVDGEEWLLNQALPAIHMLGGVRPSFPVLQEILRSHTTPGGKKKNISLIGFMGSGKSTVGRKLAARMGFSFCDTDGLIEKRAGRSVEEIFGTEGEESFRKWEKAVLAELENRERTVFACGGGAVLDPRNRETLRENSLVVWLCSSVETCLERIKKESRPLLDGGNREGKARKMFEKRLGAYACAANLVVSGEKTAGQVARKVHEEIDRTFDD
jgi:shikimate kinase